jgi:hypothetical protein
MSGARGPGRCSVTTWRIAKKCNRTPQTAWTLNLDQVDPTFVWYWLQSPPARDFIFGKAKGTSSTMKKISQGVVIAIPFPTHLNLPEQRRIVAELDRLQTEADSLCSKGCSRLIGRYTA